MYARQSSRINVSNTSRLDLKDPSLTLIKLSPSQPCMNSNLLSGKAIKTCTLSAQEISTPFITSIYSLSLF